jgi:hypothetical protein
VPQIEGLITKLELLEANLHNPKAKVVYDILGMKGAPGCTRGWPPCMRGPMTATRRLQKECVMFSQARGASSINMTQNGLVRSELQRLNG